MRKLTFIVLFLLAAISGSAGNQSLLSKSDIVEQIRQNPARAACGHNPYEVPACAYTKAPAGYKAFYVNHIGRHGSRYQTGDGIFKSVLPALDSINRNGLLTPVGDTLYNEIRRMADAHDDNIGLLTQKGSLELAGMGRRLAEREPDVFSRKDAREVFCRSTKRERVIQSMANFVTALKGECPRIDIIYHIGLGMLPDERVDRHYFSKNERDELIRPILDSLMKAYPYTDDICRRIFTDPKQASKYTGKKYKFVFKLLDAAQGYACMDIDVNPFRFFTAEELAGYAEVHNLHFAASYGGMMESNPITMHHSDALLRAMVRDADAAIEGNGRCADLRFAHDGNVGPLLSLIAPSGSEVDVPKEKAVLQWQSWKRICMGTNFQMVFYRDRKGDVLVKLLRNEEEVTIPALEAVSGVFYRWDGLREYFLERIGDLQGLPSYWKDEVEAKAARIRELQKDEAGGFFFWTDSHYPENAGNTPAVISAVNKGISPRRVFFGGDMSANNDDFVTGLFPQFKAMQQLRGSAGFYPLRGNHDIVTRTKPRNAERKVMPQWKVAEFFREYTSEGAVYNEGDETSCYFYCDDAAAKIRYIAFDTTDNVLWNGVRHGISPSQMKWMVEKAIFGTPKGWKLVILSHKPFVSEKKNDPAEPIALIKALNTHGVFEYDGRSYDFSTRGDLKLLFVLSGHRHKDMFFPDMGIPQVVMLADKNLDYKKSKAIEIKENGTVDEQAFDYVSVSRDFKTVTMVRIGQGKDRIFDLENNAVK